MTEVGQLKWIEVSVLLLAGGLFVWWQLRDVRQAQEKSRRQRELRDAADAAAPADAPHTPASPDDKESPRL